MNIPNISENLFYAIAQIISVSHYEIRSFTMYHWYTVRILVYCTAELRGFDTYTHIKKSFVSVYPCIERREEIDGFIVRDARPPPLSPPRLSFAGDD